jgi:hypothetical protein
MVLIKLSIPHWSIFSYLLLSKSLEVFKALTFSSYTFSDAYIEIEPASEGEGEGEESGGRVFESLSGCSSAQAIKSLRESLGSRVVEWSKSFGSSELVRGAMLPASEFR